MTELRSCGYFQIETDKLVLANQPDKVVADTQGPRPLVEDLILKDKDLLLQLKSGLYPSFILLCQREVALKTCGGWHKVFETCKEFTLTSSCLTFKTQIVVVFHY